MRRARCLIGRWFSNVGTSGFRNVTANVTRSEDGVWVGDTPDAKFAAAQVNARERGDLVASPYRADGTPLPPAYSEIVSPHEAGRREAVAKCLGVEPSPVTLRDLKWGRP